MRCIPVFKKNRFSGNDMTANYSWLEATPTSQCQQWERHLAAICEYFESV
jgi:hypothetical protein